LYFIPISDAPFKIIILNFITDLPPNMKEGYFKFYNAILIIVYKFTKFAVYIPIKKDINAAGLINLLIIFII
jgi:hypothetical protein